MIWYIASCLASLTFLLGLLIGAWLNRYPWCSRAGYPYRRATPTTGDIQ